MGPQVIESVSLEEIPELKQALESPQVDEAQKAEIKALLQDTGICSLYRWAQAQLTDDRTRRDMKFDFAGLLIMWSEWPVAKIQSGLVEYYKFLLEEHEPEVTSAFRQRLGFAPGRREISEAPQVQGKALMTYKDVAVFELPDVWNAEDGGIYVGDGSATVTRSVFREHFAKSIPIHLAQQALNGRRLYVLKDEVSAAKEVIDAFQIKAGNCWDQSTWKQWLRFWLDKPEGLSISFVGLVLKVGLSAKPGQLGNFVRVLPACARTHFRSTPCELLPIALPEDTANERKVIDCMFRCWNAGAVAEEEMKEIAEASLKAGHDAWTWLQVLLIDYLYCGSGRVLGQVMPHPTVPTVEQQETLKELRRFAELLVQGDQFPVQIKEWETLRQDLGDLYAGKEVQKDYPLTWRAIAPHVPGKNEAGRISLSDTVSEELKPYVDDPGLLRIPDHDLGEIRHAAPVMVDSDEEFDLIVSKLVEAKMLEREVPEETLTVNNRAVYNGMFGVHKSWRQDDQGHWERTLRLIINLIPSNRCQSRLPIQPSKGMSYAPMWGSMVLQEGELILAYGEDIKHCFHIFSPGYSWRGYFVLNKKASATAFGDGMRGHARPRVISAPIGWSNIVDFVQSSLERMGTLAGVPSNRVIKMNEPAPMLPLTTPRSYHSFYVDNYDGFTVICESDLGRYEGKASDQQLQLREVFKVWGVERDERKAAEGVLEWASLGAEQLGKEGLVGSARKLRRAVLGAVLNVLKLDPGLPRGSKELLTIVGKAMHSTQYCKPLACLFDELYREVNAKPGYTPLNIVAEEELLLLLMGLPQHWLDQRLKMCPTVYATDASPDGGGACASTGLSARGRAKCRLLCLGDDDSNCMGDKIVLVEAFGGIGGLRKAAELIGLLPLGIIFIDADPTCVKLAKRHCAYVLTYNNIKDITKDTVLDWRRTFSGATKVVLGGGWPCVNHSRLNSGRQGADADSSRLLDSMLKIRAWLEECSPALRVRPWKVCEIFENVLMDEADLRIQSKAIGYTPVFCEASQVMWCRRPRLWWIRGFDLVEGIDLKVKASQQVQGLDKKVATIHIDTERPPLQWALREDAVKLCEPDQPFYTFARPHPKSVPPAHPTGYEQCDQKTLGRWKGDAYRLAPYQYQERNLVRSPQGVRRLQADEQLRMLGFNSDHLSLKQKLNEDQRQQLVGNTWPVLLVARLLLGLIFTENEATDRDLSAELWQIWRSLEDRTHQLSQPSWSRKFGPSLGTEPGLLRLRKDVLEMADFSARARIDPHSTLTDEELLIYMVSRGVSHRGTDVRIDTGVPFVASDFCRRSLDPTHWEWKVLMSYKWKKPGQITQLEAVAVQDLLKKLGRGNNLRKRKLLILVDNQPVVSILTKGRSSAKQLQSPLRRCCAVLLATSSRLLVGWVKSEWNPADGPSRWIVRRVQKDA